MTKFDPTKPVILRNGMEAGIYATDHQGPQSIIGWWVAPDGVKRTGAWLPRGENVVGEETEFDLINIPEEPIVIEAWALVDSSGKPHTSDRYATKSEALQGAPVWATPVRLSGTFTPGEGLDDD